MFDKYAHPHRRIIGVGRVAPSRCADCGRPKVAHLTMAQAARADRVVRDLQHRGIVLAIQTAD